MILTGKAVEYAEYIERFRAELGIQDDQLTEKEQTLMYALNAQFTTDESFRIIMELFTMVYSLALITNDITGLAEALKGWSDSKKVCVGEVIPNDDNEDGE